MVGLGWDVNAYDSGAEYDLDAAVFMTGADGKCPSSFSMGILRIRALLFSI